MTLPYGRTYDEIFLYMGLRPCLCGETELDDQVSTSLTVDGGPAERFSGRCASCGRSRHFTFAISEEPPPLSFDVQYGGDEPSQLLDPGEWLGVAELYTSSVDAGTPDDGLADDEDITRAYYLLSSAAAALDEAVKFIPDGADQIPEGAFTSQAGRMIYEMMPERFTRAQLETERDRAHAQVREFADQYGTDDDEDDPTAAETVAAQENPPAAEDTAEPPAGAGG